MNKNDNVRPVYVNINDIELPTKKQTSSKLSLISSYNFCWAS